MNILAGILMVIAFWLIIAVMMIGFCYWPYISFAVFAVVVSVVVFLSADALF